MLIPSNPTPELIKLIDESNHIDPTTLLNLFPKKGSIQTRNYTRDYRARPRNTQYTAATLTDVTLKTAKLIRDSDIVVP